MITYTNQNGRKIGSRRLWQIDVRLDGKRVGEIIHLANGYAYKPEGSRKCGPVFATLAGCKRSIEGIKSDDGSEDGGDWMNGDR